MPLRKKSFGCQFSHSWTSCITSSLLQNLFRPDAPLGGQRGDILREQGLDYMEDVVEHSISVSGWCPWCEQPCVDRHYPGEMTWCLRPISLVPGGCLYWAFEKCRVICSVYCAMLCEEIHVKYTFRFPEDGDHNLPSRERDFCFFGFWRPWMTPLHWRTFTLGHEVMHPRLVRCHDRIPKKSPSCSYHDDNDCATCSRVLSCSSVNKHGIHWVHTFEYWGGCLAIVFTLPSLMFSIPDNFWTYSSVHPNECINVVTVFACYGSPRPAFRRFNLHRFPSFFKRTAPLLDTNIWQCLLTIQPLQSSTDFRRFATFFYQEFDYNVLFHANVYVRFAHLPHNWQNCAVANIWSVNDLGTVLPHITTFIGPCCIFELWTNYNSYLPAPCILPLTAYLVHKAFYSPLPVTVTVSIFTFSAFIFLTLC